MSDDILFQSIVTYFDIQIELRVQRINQKIVFITTYMSISPSMYMNTLYYCIREGISVLLSYCS